MEKNQELKDELKDAFREVLEEVGLIDPYIERGDIVAMVGRRRYDRAVKNGIIKREKGDGRNAKVRVLRVEFAKMIREGQI